MILMMLEFQPLNVFIQKLTLLSFISILNWPGRFNSSSNNKCWGHRHLSVVVLFHSMLMVPFAYKGNKQHMNAPKFIVKILFLLSLLCTSSQGQMQLLHFLVMEMGLYMTIRQAKEFLQTLESSRPVSQNTLRSMEEFTIQFVYNNKVNKTLGEALA